MDVVIKKINTDNYLLLSSLSYIKIKLMHLLNKIFLLCTITIFKCYAIVSHTGLVN